MKTAAALLLALSLGNTPARAGNAQPTGKTIDVGETGFAHLRPVMASACPHACPWGEIGDFVRAAMRPLGYDVVLCRNCNRAEGSRLVSRAALPPPLVEDDLLRGTTERFDRPVDFGVTEAGMLNWAYEGRFLYAQDGPMRNLRLIARIEDPTYMLVATARAGDIHSLADAVRSTRPLHIITDMEPTSLLLLESAGLSPDVVRARGGTVEKVRDNALPARFDLLVSGLGSPAMNPESSYWTTLSQRHDLRFLDVPPAIAERLVAEAGMRTVVARWGMLRGIDRDIQTVGRSGESVFTRDDVPEQAAYDIARAIDEARGQLIWYARPYSYDSRTVASSFTVPLHPGAARYYREMGYIR